MNRLAITLTAACLIAPFLAKAEVESMSSENFRVSDGVRYWVVAVTCEGDTTQKLMKRVVGGGSSWCSADDGTLCNDSKSSLSRNLCGLKESAEQANDQSQNTAQSSAEPVQAALQAPTNIQGDSPAPASADTGFSSSAGVASANTALEDRKSMLLREQVNIEEQRILIEQKRLELVQQELALKKQRGN